MRFNQIIHPEIALLKKGTKDQRQFYKHLLPQFFYNGFGKGFTGVVDLDPNLGDHFCLVQRYLLDGGKNYHINRDFLEAISKVDKSIPLSHLPDKFSAYISFAKDVLQDETDYIQGAYVFVGPAGETSFGNSSVNSEITSPDQKVLWISYIGNSEAFDISSLRMPIEEKHFKETLSRFGTFDFGPESYNFTVPIPLTRDTAFIKQREIIYRTLLNLVIFITQPDDPDFNPEFPKLVTTKPNKLLPVEKLLKLRDKADQGAAIYNSCSLPITFVNWRWSRPMGLHTVSGHFRWQAWGPRHTLRKLIWINEFEKGQEL